MRRTIYLLFIIILAFFVYSNRQAIISWVKPYIKNVPLTPEAEKLLGINKAEFSKGQVVNTKKEISQPGPLAQILGNENSDGFSYQEIIAATNNERLKAGLKPLTENKILNSSATYKSNDMNDRQYFEHESPDGKNIEDLAKMFKYEYVTIGENLALGNFSNEQKIVDAWMNSPGHRANILNPKYTQIGIGLVEGVWQGRKVWFAVQHFGKPLSECPTVDKTLKDLIEKSQTTLGIWSGQLETQKNEIQKMGISSSGYESLVKAYNDFVAKYNDLVNKTKQQIDKYNSQVKAFNTCSQG